MFTKAFLTASAERAIKSAAQAVTLVWFGLSDTGPANLFEMDLEKGLGVAAGGALLSLLTSIISAPIGGGGVSPSLAPKAEVDAALGDLVK